MQGTPVKSCITTRAGVNWISVSGSAVGTHEPSARIWSAVTFAPSSVRSRFSSSTLRLNGSFSYPSTASTAKISKVLPPTVRSVLAPKLSTAAMSLLTPVGPRRPAATPLARYRAGRSSPASGRASGVARGDAAPARRAP